jgi:hypothetical protein
MILSFKPGVRLDDLVPQAAAALPVVAFVYQHQGALSCVITSVNDGTHGPNSLHAKGRAFDVRTKDYVGDKVFLRDKVKAALGDNFDVVLEDEGGPNEHLHVEYDPKG